jgi:polysaccharide biosynthesis transport protein
MDSQSSSPEFTDYLHAIARRKGLLFGIAIPVAVLAVLLAVALPDVYTSSAIIEIDEPQATGQPLNQSSSVEASYADQYVQNLKAIVLTDGNLRKLLREHDLYPNLADDESAMLKRVRKDIGVNIVTTPIIDPRTGREAPSGWWQRSSRNTGVSGRAARPMPRSSTPRKPSASAIR